LKEAVEALKKAGVRGPTRIPWSRCSGRAALRRQRAWESPTRPRWRAFGRKFVLPEACPLGCSIS